MNQLALVSKMDVFKFQIADVLTFDEWGTKKLSKKRVGLAAINKQNLEKVVAAFGHGTRAGEVIFFLSADKQRARAVMILSKNPRIYAVSFLDFGKLTPELVISQWAAQAFSKTQRKEFYRVIDEQPEKIKADMIAWMKEAAPNFFRRR